MIHIFVQRFYVRDIGHSESIIRALKRGPEGRKGQVLFFLSACFFFVPLHPFCTVFAGGTLIIYAIRMSVRL
jgi:hypothetical protein